MDQLALHPTVKPVALLADAIKDCSKHDGIVLDCFAGSGTTLIAAERTGRRAYAMELDPKYVDAAVQRYEHLFGEQAIHAKTGMSFANLRDWLDIEGDGVASNDNLEKQEAFDV